jgi:hypothetical protein
MKPFVRWLLLAVLGAGLAALAWWLVHTDPAALPAWQRYGARSLLVALALGAWFLTQSLIGSRPIAAEGRIGDLVHDLTAPANRWLQAHPAAANRLLIGSSLGIDLFGLGLLGSAILGDSLRPFVALILLFAFRQLCQACCALPPPPGLIWRSPGFPSLLVTYGVANDFFISGHTAIAVLGAIEAWHQLPPWAAAVATAVAVGEAITVLLLRAHYTMDVLAAITAAGCAWILAARIC